MSRARATWYADCAAKLVAREKDLPTRQIPESQPKLARARLLRSAIRGFVLGSRLVVDSAMKGVIA